MNEAYVISPKTMKRCAWFLYFSFIPLTLLDGIDAENNLSILSLIFVCTLTFVSFYVFLLAPRQSTNLTFAKPVRMGARLWAIVIDSLVSVVCLSGIMTLLKSSILTVGMNVSGVFDAVFLLICYSAPLLMNWAAF